MPEMPTDRLRIPVDRARLEAFCRRWKITELAFFGSVPREDFGPDSDVDVVVTYSEHAHWGWDVVEAQDELQQILGRKVDLVNRKVIEESENPIRRKAILESAETFVVAG